MLHRELELAWGSPAGLRGMLTVVNHGTLGLRFMVTGLVFFLLGGVLAMLVRTQLAFPDQDFMSPDVYSQVTTMHGTVMMFLFAIPVLEGLAIYLIPKMIGTRDLACPRLTAFGYWCYLFGGIILFSSLLLDMAPDSGWFMYTPLSSGEYSPGSGSDFWLLGITFVEISALSAGVELTVSILRTRASGMALHRMPLFAWYILAMALMIVVGFPPLILGSVLLELERAVGMPFFAVAGGGDPVLWQHLFWLFGHPEVYIIFLPAAGIVSTLIPVFAGRPMVGYGWIVASILITGFISFGLWVHHMFTVGIPQLAQAFFSAASMLVAVPTAIQVFVWLTTLWLGRPRMTLPMLWVLGFLVIFVCGGLTGVMLALVPFNWQVHDTHFVVAHMHYVLVGGMFFPLMAGLYYWLPLVTGRMPSESLGRLGFWLTFSGFNLTFLIMHWTGLLGMPRRIASYESAMGWDIYNLISSVGGFMMSAGIAVVLLDLALHGRFGRLAPRNPWCADTLEWAVATPPTSYTFASLPQVTSRHPLWEFPQLGESIRLGEHERAGAPHGRRELLGTDPLTGRVREIIHLPGNSVWPLAAALVLAVVCISLLVRLYPLALVAFVVAACMLLRWSWENGAHASATPLGDNEPSDPALHSRTPDGPGRWTMGVALLADGAFFLSLLFGWCYLWTVSPQWRMPDVSPLSLPMMIASGLALTLAASWLGRRCRAIVAGREEGLARAFAGIAALGGVHLLLLLTLAVQAALAPTDSAHDAVLWVGLAYLLVHATLATVLMLLQARRAALGLVSARLPFEPGVVLLFWRYHTGAYWILVAAIGVLPRVLGANA
ncbi:cytochrome ubiquinol oxidase subunit I [Halomonas urumqiensis]|nr:cytochrome ubiquinol oxidase subunit I [Halomonas urumqiensis]